MGLRFRKSVKIGSAFKINISKSGVGYSVGTKGYRLTKTANGRVRRTASIPGTGVSHVKETSLNNTKSRLPVQDKGNYENVQMSNVDERMKFENNVSTIETSEGLQLLANSIRRTIILEKTFCISFIVLFVAFCISRIYDEIPVAARWCLFIAPILIAVLWVVFAFVGSVKIDYDIDDDVLDETKKQGKIFVDIARSKKVWKIQNATNISNTKYNAGAQANVSRKECKIKFRAVFPVRTNSEVLSITDKKEKLIFLPDMFILIFGSKVKVVKYADLKIETGALRFVESESVPQDTQVIDYRWEKITNNGQRDKRFANNKQLPICNYGGINLASENGVNIFLMFSDVTKINSQNT